MTMMMREKIEIGNKKKNRRKIEAEEEAESEIESEIFIFSEHSRRRRFVRK